MATKRVERSKPRKILATLKRLVVDTKRIKKKVKSNAIRIEEVETKCYELARLARAQILQFALSHSSLAAFTFRIYVGTVRTYEDTSGFFLRLCLLEFLKGSHKAIPAAYFVRESEMIGPPTPDERAKFREQLEKQVHALTGIKPKWELKPKESIWDTDWTISLP